MKWFEIEQPVSKEKFEKPKIMTPAISEKSSFYFDETGLYCYDSCNMIFPKPEKKEFAFYLTAILNSKLIFFFLTSFSPYVQAKYFTYKPQYLKPLPIYEYKDTNLKCKKISELSKQLHIFLKKDPDGEEERIVKDMKKEIDNLVFELYGISQEECKVIEKAIE